MPNAPTPSLLIRADASVHAGTGHVMRMLALAQAWQRRGGQVHLLSHTLPHQLAQRVAAEAVVLHHLDAAAIVSGATDQRSTIDLAHHVGATWVVADGYGFTSEFQTAIRRASLRLTMVTDFDYCREWSADRIVNQNPHASREPYRCDVGDCQRLFGTRYVLLRREFVTAREATEGQGLLDRPRRLLVTLGGSDAENVTGEILEVLARLDTEPIDVRVLVGMANPHHKALQQHADLSPHKVEILSGVDDMPAQYQWADGVLTAGGSSCWEWMYFGLPAAVIVIAENQQPIYDELVEHQVAIGLGHPQQVDIASLQEFVQSLTTEAGDLNRFRNWVDGYGADRIASAMGSGVWLRRATATDCRLYFDWANDPTVRNNSLQSSMIAWEEHCEWFCEQIARDDRRLFLSIRGEQPVGQVRMSLTPDREWQLGFSVAAEARGSGLGGEILRLGIAAMRNEGEHDFVATVKQANVASAKCFERLGWKRTQLDQTYQYRSEEQ
ncbi:UDP-2,4-diacetamido-2,4,6-trideoxy-beta-L-altropyranose hydrolase [Allorhodopirellula solitaria]|uniref:Undecaprenyldiphospho-muramoylpentapeptide beta-N-acetylglucosaminyltransferase n=1 Tax=Allorhodopirellula solitaria TaxID=2527987 RepID=A0A5C5XUH5_9BACT|nr:UDP-2,4-diacetamido-2,4,6-trideoxy-beta-L-altropyranose hydrolase [Allorhodopirellula solitaria]TWT66209.1 undecaprenyldiphospho-muramoylpentapeptide beta-N- acetylglucosaminyltransferase [Allorhodopirellula solitaria]